MGNDLYKTLAQFTYLKCMIVFNEEEEMKKERRRKQQEEEDKKRKSASIFSIAK